MLIKPKALKKGDKVAIVSLSSGLGGEEFILRRYQIGAARLQQEFGLVPVAMPNALRGIDYLDKNPKARAEDWMQAFEDPGIQGVFSMIGGNDTIRLLPYIDLDTIGSNPKVFMGFSDTTINHFMMYRAGVVSFYGPAILEGFAENCAMHTYTKQCVQHALFSGTAPLPITKAPEWTSEMLDWAVEENNGQLRALNKERHGYELLQGRGKVQGRLLGGCLDVFQMLFGTSIWPKAEEWKEKLLFLETSEEMPAPNEMLLLLRGMMAQGILDAIAGVVVGKPYHEKYYEEYKEILVRVFSDEAGRPDLPVLYNINFGHCAPMCVLPYGILAEIDCETHAFTLLESGVVVK